MGSTQLPAEWQEDSLGLTQERFGFTLFVSLCVHAVLILGVGFTVASQSPSGTLDITLATFESELAPEDADFLAQANQQGSGTEAEALAPATDVLSRFSDTVIREVDDSPQQLASQPPPAEQQTIATDSATAVLRSEPADPAPTDEAPTAVEPDGAAPDGPAGVLYETLAALGIDPEAAEYETGDHWAGDQVTLVTAHLVVDGERAGATWQAEIVEDTVYSFNGPLAPLVELGDYDVVGPAQAVERLSDPRFGHSDFRIAADTGPAPDLAVVRPWGTPPADPPAPGTAVPWPVREVTITGAELTLTMTTTEDGVTLLLPAYSLSDSDGGTWTVVALAEHELAF